MAIYDDAVVDAKKLREVAEATAKQQVLEAITPRIREMINARILHEQEDYPIDDEELVVSDEVDETEGGIEGLPVATVTPSAVVPAEEAVAAPQQTVTIHSTGPIHIGAESGDVADTEEEAPAVLSDQMAESLARMIRNEKRQKDLRKKVDNLCENYQLFKKAVGRLSATQTTQSQKQKVRDTYQKLAQDAISLRGEVVAYGRGSQHLERKLVETLKEMKKMSSKTKRNIFDFLFEGDDEDKKKEDKHMDEAELSLTLDDDEKAELADKGKDEIEDALSGVLGNVSFDLGGDDEAGDDETAESDDDSGEGEGEGEGEKDELDLGEMHEMEMREDDKEKGDKEKGDKEETVYEIDESALRRELDKMKKFREFRELKARKLREARARRAKLVREQAESEADQFGGGEVVGDVFGGVDEDSLVNVLADELGSVSSVKEARLRKALKEAADYKKAAETLKGQLVEMNLFNAKLLYANKLLQNKELTVKQQRAIVEALDNANTLHEVKLLYKSLSESLAKRGQKSGTVSENVNRTVLGSSSKSIRSAQPASSGVEVDRWAVLAGISEGK
jgi:hypothetical protein